MTSERASYWGLGHLEAGALRTYRLIPPQQNHIKPSSCHRVDSFQMREEQCSESLEDAVKLGKSFSEKLVMEAVIFKRIEGDKIPIALTFERVCVLANRTGNSWNRKRIVHYNSSMIFEHHIQKE